MMIGVKLQCTPKTTSGIQMAARMPLAIQGTTLKAAM